MTEAFFEAIRRGDEAAVDGALDREPELATSHDANGLSAVLAAAYANHPRLADRLAAGRHGRLPIFEAAAVGDLASIAHALDEDDDVDGRNADGFTALHLAAFFGQLDAARLLLERGADPNAVAGNDSRVTPLHSAVAGRHRDLASLLLIHSASPNAVQKGGFTALHTTAGNGDEATSEMLLMRGADPSIAADDGRTPPDLADAAGNAALADVLREAQR